MFYLYRIFIICSLFCVSSFAHASIGINEIMYNPEGTDTNREWVEIYNAGSTPVNIDSWFFYENDIYHGLYPDGFTTLNANEYALIVKNIDAARNELGSQIKFIKSSFSLNNTGELIALADENKTHIDSYVYDVNLGANGDGKSLQKISGSWLAASPSPGLVNNQSSASSTPVAGGSSSTSSSSSSKQTTKKTNPPEYKVVFKPEVIIPDIIVAQSDFAFGMKVLRQKGPYNSRTMKGYYYINFGDGFFIESEKPIQQSYHYRSPGEYILTMEYYTSRLAFNAGDKPDAFFQKKIHVTANTINIVDSNHFKGVTLKNMTQKPIKLDYWRLSWKDYEYLFPRHSTISAGAELSIIYSNLGFSPDSSLYEPLRLMTNTYAVVDIFPKKKYQKKQVKKQVQKKSPPLVSGGEEKSKKETHSSESFFEQSTYLDEYLEQHPDKIKVNFGDQANMSQKDSTESKNMSRYFYYALGALLLMLGSARFIKYKNNKEINTEVPPESTLGEIKKLD